MVYCSRFESSSFSIRASFCICSVVLFTVHRLFMFGGGFLLIDYATQLLSVLQFSDYMDSIAVWFISFLLHLACSL